jgi:hypothetical protein
VRTRNQSNPPAVQVLLRAWPPGQAGIVAAKQTIETSPPIKQKPATRSAAERRVGEEAGSIFTDLYCEYTTSSPRLPSLKWNVTCVMPWSQPRYPVSGDLLISTALPVETGREVGDELMPHNQASEYLNTMVTTAITLLIVGSLLGLVLLRVIP